MCTNFKYILENQSYDTLDECRCPDDCNEHVYTPSLSLADISTSKMQQLISNSNRTLQRHLDAMETQHRVDNTQFQQTVSALKKIISSHQPLKKLIYDDIVNPVTSLTNTILTVLKKTAETFKNDAVNLRTNILEDLSACYDKNLSFIVQSLSYQLDSLAHDLPKIQMTILKHDESELRSLGGDSLSKFLQLITLLKDARENISLFSDANCPTNLLSDECARMFDSMDVSLQDISSRLYQVSDLSYPSDRISIRNLVYVTIEGLKQGVEGHVWLSDQLQSNPFPVSNISHRLRHCLVSNVWWELQQSADSLQQRWCLVKKFVEILPGRWHEQARARGSDSEFDQ